MQPDCTLPMVHLRHQEEESPHLKSVQLLTELGGLRNTVANVSAHSVPGIALHFD